MFFEQILMYIHKSVLMYFFACFFVISRWHISCSPLFLHLHVPEWLVKNGSGEAETTIIPVAFPVDR